MTWNSMCIISRNRLYFWLFNKKSSVPAHWSLHTSPLSLNLKFIWYQIVHMYVTKKAASLKQWITNKTDCGIKDDLPGSSRSLRYSTFKGWMLLNFNYQLTYNITNLAMNGMRSHVHEPTHAVWSLVVWSWHAYLR